MECPPTGHGTFGEAGVKKREHLPGDLAGSRVQPGLGLHSERVGAGILLAQPVI